jgi:hypothetical protein
MSSACPVAQLAVGYGGCGFNAKPADVGQISPRCVLSYAAAASRPAPGPKRSFFFSGKH